MSKIFHLVGGRYIYRSLVLLVLVWIVGTGCPDTERPTELPPCNKSDSSCFPKIVTESCTCECPEGTFEDADTCKTNNELHAIISGQDIPLTFDYYTDEIDKEFFFNKIIIDAFINSKSYIYLRFESDDGTGIKPDQTYTLRPKPGKDNYASFRHPFALSNEIYGVDSGFVKVLTVDLIKQIMTAEFEFSCISPGGQRREVKHGYFRLGDI